MVKLIPFSSLASWRFLHNDLVALDLEDLPGFWRRTILHVRCKPPCGLEAGPWLPGFIRGAWGKVLLDWAKSYPGPANNIPARDIFFTTPLKLSDGHEVPPPFVISIDPDGGDLIIELTLFGRAAAWRQEAFDALLAALGNGISIRAKGGRPMEPFRLLEVDWTQQEAALLPQTGSSARLYFVTPVGYTIPAELIKSMVRRVIGLAQWQGVAITMPDMFVETLEYDERDMRPDYWRRQSSVQSNKIIPIGGMRGALHIYHLSQWASTVIGLCETCFAGQNPSFGLGRFILS